MTAPGRITRTWTALAAGALLCLAGAVDAFAAMRHVHPGHPAARDAGDGSAQQPYRSLSYAMQQLMPGDTLTIYAGVYRDALIFPKRTWSVQTPTVIVGKGEVTLLGSDVVGEWVKQAPGVFVRRDWTSEPQQVRVGGLALRQVGGTVFEGYPEREGHALGGLHRDEGGIWPGRLAGGRHAMPPDSFFYDSARRELVIRKDAARLAPGSVEVATRTYLVQGEGVAGITLRNLRFQHANTTTISRAAAITLEGDGNTLEKLVVEDVDGVGIQVAGRGNLVQDCTVLRAGYLGLKARGEGNRIVGNRIAHNNTRGFNKWWEAGGMKFIGQGALHRSLVADNVVAHNRGDGIWFDWGNDDNRIERNVTAYNDGFGIHYEASSRGTIVDNRSFGNGQRGIYLYQSRDSLVAHNLVVGNTLEGIAVIDDARTDPEGKLDLRPRNNRILANLVAWNAGPALLLPGPQFASTADGNLYLHEHDTLRFAMGWPRGDADRKRFDDWRRLYAQDRESLAVQVPPPAALAQALATRNEQPDWSALAAYQTQAAARRRHAAPTDDAHVARAGPRR